MVDANREGQDTWQHPWLRIERVLRAAIGDRMSHGLSDERDNALAAVTERRQQIKRAGWFTALPSASGENSCATPAGPLDPRTRPG